MLKKTITYTDFEGIERTEDFFFHLSEAEVIEMEHSVDGGLTSVLTNIVKSPNPREIVKYFKEIILRSYGEKSSDGRRFVKSPELSKQFAETPAYSVLFMELSKDDKAASNFVNSVIPQKKSSVVPDAVANAR